MLERDAELAALAHAAREAADRHGSVVLVKGEAGIGKSSLVEALRSHLPAAGRMLVGAVRIHQQANLYAALLCRRALLERARRSSSSSPCRSRRSPAR